MDDIKVQNEGNFIQIKKSDDSPKISLNKKQNKSSIFQNFMKRPQTAKVAPPQMQRNFDDFSNPDKRHDESEEESEEDGTVASEEEEGSVGSDVDEYSENGEDDEELSPSEGYASLEEEKQDLLYKLHRIKQKGVHISNKLSVYSDIRELRAEVNKIRKDAQIDSGLKMSKKALMAIVSGLEFLNNRYDPFEVELEGWSETVMLNVNDGDYDNCLERICEKYAGKSNTPPEIEILLTLAGSAMMFHITNSMFKKQFKGPSMPIPGYEPKKKSPAPEREVPMDPGSARMDQSFANVKEMKGPSFDISSLMGGMGMGRFPPMPMMSEPRKPQVVIEESSESSDSEDSIGGDSKEGSIKNISITSSQAPTGRKRRTKVTDDKTFSL